MENNSIPHIHHLVPHRGAMCLLDAVIAHDADTVEALTAVRGDSPFADGGAVGAWLGIEYMAQAVAAFAGLRAHAHGKPAPLGLLVGTRRYTALCERFAAGSSLRVRAERKFEADNGMASFDCRILGADDTLLAEATLMVFQPEDPAQVIAAPGA
jgi:predicted hotdog family 3-hydroxylacyl-ACP dehydratase